MKYLKLIMLCCFSAVLFSCKDDDAKRQAENIKAAKQNDSILKVISDNWKFNIPPLNPKVGEKLSGWTEWEQLNNELMQRPVGSLNAYRQKTKSLVTKTEMLRNNIPEFFNRPQVKSRISVLDTRVKSLSTYINLEVIPAKRVIELINSITHEVTSLQNQMNELVILKEVPKETGEDEMLKALDTIRMANPDAMPQPQSSTPSTRPGFSMPGANRN
ncbi:hypothetical protein R1T16_04250 [Flavobacterium sp. DG1-102-2]|uniref:hypothetical protein n=1 Tax=Flavobacterium sp. DG1-102-2 TaxID=3081663 RepID=UPI002949DA32|nr:hypothetical protein [Flavobacterium sp. DG1-102-2]MDV6167622.1 hypothetical protein [Flavobacterium sp. DG1-102-2]